MPNLITRDELKAALGIPPSQTAEHAKLDFMIAAGSQAVINYAGRNFGEANETETRQFEYDGSGILDIDDATAITAVTYTWNAVNYPYAADTWRPQPFNDPVYYYILMPKTAIGGISPEMGFTHNLDVLAREGRWPYGWLPTVVNVTATFGWPVVPDDVKMAVIWTVAGLRDQPGLYVTESIEGYSRSTNQRTVPVAVPERARDILAMYQKLYV